jgi:hypothetical protein
MNRPVFAPSAIASRRWKRIAHGVAHLDSFSAMVAMAAQSARRRPRTARTRVPGRGAGRQIRQSSKAQFMPWP